FVLGGHSFMLPLRDGWKTGLLVIDMRLKGVKAIIVEIFNTDGGIIVCCCLSCRKNSKLFVA
ncbi:MAG: hypothetical protein P8X63_03690, partial [Desulfuromonadaceae bacterium]